MDLRERQRAYQQVAYALRTGRLARRPCGRCSAEPTQAHHADYGRPLDVEWLCLPCHMNAHGRSIGRNGDPRKPGTHQRDPIWDLFEADGRKLVWLADRTGYSRNHVYALHAGTLRPGPHFRRECARVLGMAIDDLFHGGGVHGSSSAATPGVTPGSESNGRAGTANQSSGYPRQEAPSIGHSA